MIDKPGVFVVAADDGRGTRHPPFDIHAQGGVLETADTGVGDIVMYGHGGEEHPTVVQDLLAMVEEEEGVVGKEFLDPLAFLFHFWWSGLCGSFLASEYQKLSCRVQLQLIVNGLGEFHFRIARQCASVEQSNLVLYHNVIPVACTPEGSMPEMRNAVSFNR